MRHPTHAQLSRWLAFGLLASSAALGGAVVVAQSLERGDPAAPAASSPAAPTAPPAFTPDTRPPPDPRTPVEISRDATIADRVKKALADDHLTREQAIDIEVTRGITNLSGVVTTQAIAQRALSIARATGGVTAVQDAMKVEGDEPVRVVR